ncbi:acyl-CoA dehydrogenase [Rhodobacterales bacterium HKCCE2091]|nr:acyl-CoA dehydrogenase [Rhodobacterales bacterium HKCCE2091]
MILDHIDDENRFRDALRAWLPDALSGRPERGADEDHVAHDGRVQAWWLGVLRTQKLATPHWPKEYGGVALPFRLRAIMTEELVRVDAPTPMRYMISFNHLPATLIPWGSEEQKRKYLPEIAEEGMIWCQGFSEPGAGSDLAGLRTRAVRDGDHYVLNGQKIWSSFSVFARRSIVLARTDPDAQKHAGISFFLVDLETPGIEIRPIRQINGGAKFGEIFFTDARVPVADRVGEEGMGWKIAQSTLASERGLLWFEAAEKLHRRLDGLLVQAAREGADWPADAEMRRCYTELRARAHGMRLFLREMMYGPPVDGAEELIRTAAFKVAFSTFRMDLMSFLVRLDTPDAYQVGNTEDDYLGGAMFSYLTGYSGMFGAGTNEIMKNIIAERGLGLPKG